MEHDVKITAGLGALEDFEMLVQAGADEVFCGYAPFKWNQKFGNILPVNRREVLFYHVQINNIEEMKILLKISKKYNINISVAFNALYYTSEQLEMLGEIFQELTEIGFENFIVADIGLLLYLKEKKISCKIHISGELGEVNTGTMKLLDNIGCSKQGPQIVRWIFHRKQTLEEMEKCIRFGKHLNPEMEFEAFFLNEMCHFAGGFCNSLHCDEMVHLCQIPYELVRLDGVKEDEVLEQWKAVQEAKEDYNVIGESGCGFCALWALRRIGVTHLKSVGRGKSVLCMSEDVKAVRMARALLMENDSEDEYISKMKKTIFPSNCSGNCYYRKNQF